MAFGRTNQKFQNVQLLAEAEIFIWLHTCAFLKAGIFWVESQFEKIKKNKTFA